MLVYAGIDEAGYGPMLGPLCVAASIFEVDGHDAADGPPDLWKRLAGGVCRSPADRRRRIAIEDSKKLKGANDARAHPLRHLERGVLAFLSLSGGEGCTPSVDDELFARLDAFTGHTWDVPWYGGSAALPVGLEAGQVGIASARLRRIAAAAGVRCADMACEAVDAGPFNERLRLTSSKAAVSFDVVVRLVDRIWRRWPDAHARIVVDRQGGRTGYRDPLAMCFPDATIVVLGETERISRYRLEREGGRSLATVSFEIEAEQSHLPVALASMTAKYVRELLMLRLNRWFAQHNPAVRPTAGYVQDARRWLDEMSPTIASLGVDRARLVREA